MRLSTLRVKCIKILGTAQLEGAGLFQVALSRQAFCSVMSLTPVISLHGVPLAAVTATGKKAFLNAVIGTVNDHDAAELLCASAAVS